VIVKGMIDFDYQFIKKKIGVAMSSHGLAYHVKVPEVGNKLCKSLVN